jgi:hypothetical protein
MIFSTILENESNKEIGLIFETLSLSRLIEYVSIIGNTPVDNDLFII